MGGRSTHTAFGFWQTTRRHHHRDSRLACSKHVLVRYPQHHKTLAFGPRLFDTITFTNFRETVNASIEFDQNSKPQIREVKDIRTNGSLPPEVTAFQLAEQLPEMFLGGSCFMTQAFGARV